MGVEPRFPTGVPYLNFLDPGAELGAASGWPRLVRDYDEQGWPHDLQHGSNRYSIVWGYDLMIAKCPIEEADKSIRICNQRCNHAGKTRETGRYDAPEESET